MKDEQVATLFTGMMNLTSLKSIVIKHNEFMDESEKALEALLDREYPRNLEELRLVSCKTSPKVVNKLVRRLAEGCQLKRLSLVQMQFADTNFPLVQQMLNQSPFLLELDLSWNQLKPL